MKTANRKLLMGLCTLAGALALSACETTSGGTGGGNVRGTRKPVAFTWQSEGSHSGDITATFGSGRVFTGDYFQITRETNVDRLDPLWDGWSRNDRRNSWRYWGPAESETAFVREYGGRVLANLRSEDGEHMRCRFTLITPSRGMAGGGEGRCQLSESGQEINAEFDRQS